MPPYSGVRKTVVFLDGRRLGWTAVVPIGHIPMWGDRPPKDVVWLAADAGEHAERPLASAPPARAADLAELTVAGQLLAELPAFPTADVADILDVRERLGDARIRFRAAMAAAGGALAEVPAAEFPAAVASYRREHVDAAVLNLREQMDELGAIPTLLRALREHWAVPTVASLAMATAIFDPGAAGAAAGSAAGVALTAREALARRELKRQARQQPYWYLRAVDRTLERGRPRRRGE